MGFLKKLFKGSSPENEHFQFAEGEKNLDSIVAYFVADTSVKGVNHPADTMLMISWSNMGKLCFEVYGAKTSSYYFYDSAHKPIINDKGLGDVEIYNLEGIPEKGRHFEIVPTDGSAYIISVPQSLASNFLNFSR